VQYSQLADKRFGSYQVVEFAASCAPPEGLLDGCQAQVTASARLRGTVIPGKVVPATCGMQKDTGRDGETGEPDQPGLERIGVAPHAVRLRTAFTRRRLHRDRSDRRWPSTDWSYSDSMGTKRPVPTSKWSAAPNTEAPASYTRGYPPCPRTQTKTRTSSLVKQIGEERYARTVSRPAVYSETVFSHRLCCLFRRPS